MGFCCEQRELDGLGRCSENKIGALLLSGYMGLTPTSNKAREKIQLSRASKDPGGLHPVLVSRTADSYDASDRTSTDMVAPLGDAKGTGGRSVGCD